MSGETYDQEERRQPQPEAPRQVLVGDIVHYVPNPGETFIWGTSQDGMERPAIVVVVFKDDPNGMVSAQVVLDGSNDSAFRSGPENSNTLWAPSLKYDANKGPRTWHFPNE